MANSVNAKPQSAVQIVPILAPGRIAGENCTRDPLALGPGEFPLLQNLRVMAGVATVRQGCTKLDAAPPVTGVSFRGAWSGTLNGTTYLVVAYLYSGEVRLYQLTPGVWTWAELTSDGTANPNKLFGDTRLPSDPGMCSFCKTSLTWSGVNREVLLIANPSSGYPRVWDPSATAGFQMSKLNPLNASVVGNAGSYSAYPTWSKFINLQTVTGTPTSSGGGLTLTFAGSAPSRAMGLSYNAGTAVGAWAAMQFATALDCTQAQQIIFRIDEQSLHPFFSTLKIELRQNGTTWFTVYDPTTTAYPLAFAPDTISIGPTAALGYYAADLSRFADSAKNAITDIRFTTTASAPSSTVADQICLVCASGNLLGLANWGVAYRNQYSGVESCGRIIATPVAAAPVTSVGGYALGPLFSLGPEAIPNSSELYYDYIVQAETPNLGAAIAGDLTINPTHVDYYVNYEGSSLYTYYQSAQVYSGNTGTGQWTSLVGTAATFATTIGQTANTTADVTVPLPDGSHGYIPRPTCMYRTASRLIMGGDYGRTVDLYFSEDSRPLRFRATARFVNGEIDPLSASRDTFTAPVMGICPRGDVVNGYEFGQPVLFVWTTHDAFRIYGYTCPELSSPVILGPHGLAQRNAWTRHYDTIYWVDQERQVVSLGTQPAMAMFDSTGMSPIARGRVESRLLNGSVAYTSMGAWNNKVYCTYRQTGDTASVRVLVYDEHPSEASPGTWTEDLLPFGTEGFLIYDDGTVTMRLLSFTDGGDVYLYEDPSASTDSGTAIPVEIVSAAIGDDPENGIWARELGIQCDDCGAGVTGDLAVTYLHTGAQALWTAAQGNPISLSAGASGITVWRRTADAPVLSNESNPTAYSAPAFQVDFKASMPAGKRIWSLYARVDGRCGGEDQG